MRKLRLRGIKWQRGFKPRLQKQSTFLSQISHFSSKCCKILLITTNENEALNYLFIDLQIFRIIPCPRRTLQGTIITIQFFGGNETTAGPANHHGNSPVSMWFPINRKNLYTHTRYVFALNRYFIHQLADDTIRAPSRGISISSKIPPHPGMFLRPCQASTGRKRVY